MKQSLFLLTIVNVLALVACEEDSVATRPKVPEDSTYVSVVIPPPVLSAQETSIPTVIKFGINVTADQVQDTIYYVVSEADTEGPAGPALMRRSDTTALPMKGNSYRQTFRSGLREETDYRVYALIKKGKHLSDTVSLVITTGSTD